MKRIIVSIGAATLFSAAFAQQHIHNAEAAPDTDTKSQIAAEAIKDTKKTGPVAIKDGSTARGQGSGIAKASKAEEHGQAHADAREAKPHTVPKQGATPK